jgi:acyl-CoA reductase-like NAD-dependent aldehyde dehydrogenase
MIDSAQHEKLAAETLPRPRMLVDGEWSDAGTGGSLGHVNPATAQRQADIPLAGDREVDEAVALANSTSCGLAAYVHTRSLERAHGVARRLESGSVAVNTIVGARGRGSVATPFGGVKESGFGREGGRAGVEEFLTSKNVYIGLP